MAANKSRLIYILLIVLVLLSSFNGYYFFVRTQAGLSFFNRLFGKEIDPIFQSSSYWDYMGIYESLNRMEKRKDLVVFLGDSITARFKVCEYFHQYPVLNRGIFSDTTAGLRNRLEVNCNNLDIDKCFLMIGHNDLKYRQNDEILNNFEDILNIIHADRIYIISILPTRGKTPEFNQRIIQVNSHLKKLAEKYGDNMLFLDLYPYFADKRGEMKQEFSRDGVHPNSNGYRTLAVLISRYL